MNRFSKAYIKSQITRRSKYPKKLIEYLKWRIKGSAQKKPEKVVYISEDGWVTRRIGNYLAKEMSTSKIPFAIDFNPELLTNKLIHFSSFHSLTGYLNKVLPSNNVIATVYHGNRGLSQAFDAGIDLILKEIDRLEAIVVSNSIMMKRFLSWGIPKNKLKFIPIAIETKPFDPLKREREKLRKTLGISQDEIVIGSFQKDGNGWGEGLEPKLIKGPDVFALVVQKLAKNYKVHCLLTGPARGYVKKKLEKSNIKFSHLLLDDYVDVAKYYQCLDLYLITSREEGGPKALMESMAAGVPLISTYVGMVPDLVCHGKNGFIVDSEDVSAMVGYSKRVLEDENLRKNLITRGINTVKDYDWSAVTKKYVQLYSELLE